MIKKFLQKIFKVVSYEIFFKIYGKVEKSINCSKDKRIEVKILNIDKDLKYRVFNIDDGRLYTDRIHDTAILLENKIVEEASFQLRYKGPFIHNSNIKDNIVFKKGTPRRLRNLNGSVLSLLTGGGGNHNYWHWLFDVLPRLSLCSKILKLNEVDYFLFPSLLKRFQTETLDLLNIPKHKRLSSEKFRHIKADNLLVTEHPVMVSGEATEDIRNTPSWISEWLKNSFLKRKISSSKKNFYIDRNDHSNNQQQQRSISNEDEVKKYLLNKNFISVKLQDINFIEQVNLFNNAECIVGLHGGGFANIVFCKPGTKIVELRSNQAGPPIENLAKKNNLNYNSITVESKKSEKYNYRNQQGAIEVPIKDLNKIL